MAALYAVMSYFGNVFGLTYGPIQLRFSEALCVLPFLFPATVPGLFVGCLAANLLSPYGPLDIVVGSLATLIAAVWTSRVRRRWLAPLPLWCATRCWWASPLPLPRPALPPPSPPPGSTTA